ncbi:MAG: HAMP domain-containing protein [Bacteroidales bacterium]|nr:HAMP domain-containing protein [Bacteroidales bacterium]
MSISLKLSLYFLVLIVFAVNITGAYSFYKAKDALTERTFDQLSSVRTEKKNRIESYFQERQREIELISHSLVEQNLMADSNFVGSDKIAFYLNNEENYVHAYWLSNLELKSIDTLALNNKKISQQLKHKINAKLNFQIIELSVEDTTFKPAVFLISKINSKLKEHFLIFELSKTAINKIMYENNPHNGLGKSGESYLVGQDHLMRSTSRFHSNSVYKTKVETYGVNNALSGVSGFGTYKDYRNISILGSFEKLEINGLNWIVLAEIDVEEAMTPIRSIRYNIIYIVIIITILFLSIIIIIAKRISLPIENLKKNILAFSENAKPIEMKVQGKDEISELTKAFNSMTQTITDQRMHIEKERLKQSRSIIEGQEKERRRLARELHDGLAQSVLAIKMILQNAIGNEQEKTQQILQDVQGMFSNIIREIRATVNNLMPSVLNRFGLKKAIEQLINDIQISSKIECELNIQIEYEIRNDLLNTYLYRIVQECLNNTLKYANASNLNIEIRQSKDAIFLNFEDNGQEFDTSSINKSKGNGLANIKERVNVLSGQLEIISTINKGTAVNVSIPYQADNEL